MSDEKQSTTPKFREGDVVRYEDGDEGVVIDKVDRDGDPYVRWWVDRFTPWERDRMTLLRRPVRVGDEVRLDCGGVEWAMPGFDSKRLIGPRWTHADGTPIEPPQKTSDTPTESKAGAVGSEGGALPVQRNTTPARGPEEAGTLRVQLADARGVIAHQERLVVEATEEIDWLRRELRRLDPRLWKARYGR